MWQRYYKRADFREMASREIPSKVALARMQSSLERKALRKVPRVSAVSEGVATELKEGYGLEDVAVIPNGVELGSGGSGIRTNKTTAKFPGQGVFVGALRGQKGLFRGIDGLSQSSHRPPLLIVGTGNLKQRLEEHARRRACRASFGGFVARDALEYVLQSAAFFLLPSFYEGHSVAALEACAARLPVVGFAGTGVEHSVSRANRDWLAADGNIAGLAEVLDRFVSDDKLRNEVGASNSKFAAKFDADSMVAGYESWLSGRVPAVSLGV